MNRTFGNPFRAGTQNNLLLNRLVKGPVTNGEIVYKMRISRASARLFEINQYLMDYGFRIIKHSPQKSVWVYGIGGL
jgi:hypothetical protein